MDEEPRRSSAGEIYTKINGPSTIYDPPTPGVATTSYFENDDCCAGDMDGETGEWFPTSSYKKREEAKREVEEKKENAVAQEESDSDGSSSGESEEYSDRRSKEVAKEFLDNNLDTNEPGIDSYSEPGPSTSFPPCSMFFNRVSTSYVTIDAETGDTQPSNCHAILSETGEPMSHCNGITDHNAPKELSNCALAT